MSRPIWGPEQSGVFGLPMMRRPPDSDSKTRHDFRRRGQRMPRARMRNPGVVAAALVRALEAASAAAMGRELVGVPFVRAGWAGSFLGGPSAGFTRGHVLALAPSLTPRSVLDKLAVVQMLNVHFPSTDGRTLILSRYTELNADQKLLVRQLNLDLPPQPHDLVRKVCNFSGSCSGDTRRPPTSPRHS
jgi:hypothetical protein